MVNSKRGLFWITPLLGFGLVASLTVGCTGQATPPGLRGAVIHLNAGETAAYDIDLSTIQLVSLYLHPRDPARTVTAKGGALTVTGQTVNASVLRSGAGAEHAGDLTASFEACTQIKPGKNVEIRYVFTDASGQMLEQGSAVLGSVIGPCPPSH